MGKKPKGNAATARKINVALVAGALILMSGIIWYTLRSPNQAGQTSNLPKPSVTTLDPGQFTGVARVAYEAAKEVPEVLAKLPCFCGCMQNFGHKNNLDCFHDTHGVECTTCQGIALDARQMHKNGYSIERILENIKEKYGRYAALRQ